MRPPDSVVVSERSRGSAANGVKSRAAVRVPCQLVAALALAVLCGVRGEPPAAQSPSPFARLVASLSEADGYFDTDNLVSNESSYLQVVPELRRAGISGGAYVGVGPDQNFTYIGELRPALAFIVDIRRDNLLLHLLFKALFQLSRTRVDYLAMLFGRPVPADPTSWRSASIERLVEYLDRHEAAGVDELSKRVDRVILGFGVPLSEDERRTIDRFHRRFIESGPSLRFQSSGRPPRTVYPTYRGLLLDRDSSGRQSSFLASEEAFQFVRSLEGRDLVIPVVGDLGGPSALAAVGREIATQHEQLSAFYTSNVEYYLFRSGSFSRFLQNLTRIPRNRGAVIIRSVFEPYALDSVRPGDDSASRLQRVDELLAEDAAGRIHGYVDLTH
jgi:hypothetical protein